MGNTCGGGLAVPGNTKVCYLEDPSNHLLNISKLYEFAQDDDVMSHPVEFNLWGELTGDIGPDPRGNITMISSLHSPPGWKPFLSYEFGLNDRVYGLEITQDFPKATTALVPGPVRIKTAMPPLKHFIEPYLIYLLTIELTATNGETITSMGIIFGRDDEIDQSQRKLVLD